MLHAKATLRAEIRRLEEYLKTETNVVIICDIDEQIKEHRQAIALVENLDIPVVSQQRELLICVDKGNWGCLTEQKEYELLASYEDIYMIKDDDDAINNYDAKYFKKVKAN